MRDIKVLHLEPTDVCQASCPLCARETDELFDKKQQHHLSMDKILKVFNSTKIAQLDKMFMCGNYGDPAAGKHSIDIYREFRRINPDIVLGMNSNGALKNAEWWQELGSIFNQPQDYVVFSIDGLEDTNHLYRRGVDWQKLMANANAFINAGGAAHWDMLVYQHNEHQVEACQQLARTMGFKWFRAKISKRPCLGDLKFPINWSQILVHSNNISCHALQEKSIYINAQGHINPCCWLGSNQKNLVIDFDSIQKSWSSKYPEPTCAATCRTIDTDSSFTKQWRCEIQLN